MLMSVQEIFSHFAFIITFLRSLLYRQNNKYVIIIIYLCHKTVVSPGEGTLPAIITTVTAVVSMVILYVIYMREQQKERDK